MKTEFTPEFSASSKGGGQEKEKENQKNIKNIALDLIKSDLVNISSADQITISISDDLDEYKITKNDFKSSYLKLIDDKNFILEAIGSIKPTSELLHIYPQAEAERIFSNMSDRLQADKKVVLEIFKKHSLDPRGLYTLLPESLKIDKDIQIASYGHVISDSK